MAIDPVMVVVPRTGMGRILASPPKALHDQIMFKQRAGYPPLSNPPWFNPPIPTTHPVADHEGVHGQVVQLLVVAAVAGQQHAPGHHLHPTTTTTMRRISI